MQQKNSGVANEKKTSKDYYDLTEESSKRPGEGATEAARREESDDVNEELNLGKVDSPDGDRWGENKVAVSDDE